VANCRGEAVLAPSHLVGPSALRESVTPYLPPWHIHRGLAPTEQIRREIDRRGDISGKTDFREPCRQRPVLQAKTSC
jgi:hypothetical protein